MIYLGADHRGYFLKEKIARWLLEWKENFRDLGAESLDKNDDYPQYAEKVASLVAADKKSFGILLCGSGVGVEVVANKFDGIRAGLGLSAEQICAAREDDDINILVIAADYTSDIEAKEMVKVYLKTKYKQLASHNRRLQEIDRLEKNN